MRFIVISAVLLPLDIHACLSVRLGTGGGQPSGKHSLLQADFERHLHQGHCGGHHSRCGGHRQTQVPPQAHLGQICCVHFAEPLCFTNFPVPIFCTRPPAWFGPHFRGLVGVASVVSEGRGNWCDTRQCTDAPVRNCRPCAQHLPGTAASHPHLHEQTLRVQVALRNRFRRHQEVLHL
jgi:hypothetical protein